MNACDTIADGAILIAYNWSKNTDRYRTVETFINTFFPRISEFAEPPHHVKWREVNLGASLTGWSRLESAQVWLDSHTKEKAVAEERSQFKTFLARQNANPERSPEAAAEADRLFDGYLKWLRTRGGADRPASSGAAATGR